MVRLLCAKAAVISTGGRPKLDQEVAGGFDVRTVFRFFVAVVVTASLAVPTLASAAGTATIPTRALTANGGTVTWPAMVHNAKTCSWSSSPNVAGFATTVKCKSGRVERSFRFAANPSTKAKLYTLSLTVRGAATMVDHLKVVVAGQTAPTTTTTTTTTTFPPTTTTTTVPPTTTSSSTTTTTTSTTTTTTLPLSPSPGWTSPNWSGYVLMGGSGGYQSISAEWTVPAVDCSSVPNGFTSDWVGVNGFGDQNPGLFQDGTSSYCVNGQEGDYTWWTDTREGYSSQFLFTVAPGDLIDAQVYRQPSGYWAYNVTDVTTDVSLSGTPGGTVSFSGPGTTAEWIAEDPGNPTTNLPYPLANFGSVTFTDLGLTVPSGSWPVPSYADAIEMVGPDESVEALPSTIQGSAASANFTVTYEAPGKMASAAGRAAMKHPQSTFVARLPRIATGTVRR